MSKKKPFWDLNMSGGLAKEVVNGGAVVGVVISQGDDCEKSK